MSKMTPMLRQYRQIKARYPDALVLFRLGDFYEMFEEDARIASRELELVLTSRSFSKDVRLPMCGVPHHHVVSYIAKLIERGHKVAVVEQLEDARKAKGLVKRDVVRIITPGTVVEPSLLRDKAENFLAALVRMDKNAYGLALVDLATGEFLTTQIEGPDAKTLLLEELARALPSEYVLPASLATDEALGVQLRELRAARISPLEDAHFDPTAARQVLLDHLRVVTLQGYGCQDLPLAVAAAGAVLYYLKTNQLSDLSHLHDLRTYHLAEYMMLDQTTRRNLELTQRLRDGATTGSLFGTLDRAMTAMGSRLLRRWIQQPLLDLAAIQERLNAVEELVTNAFLRADLRRLLDGLYDVERLVGRIGFGNANGRDLVALKRSLQRLPRIKKLLSQAKSPLLVRLYSELDELQDIAGLIAAAIVDAPPILIREGGLIRQGYHADLDRLHEMAGRGHDQLLEIEARERERTGIKNLRIRYNEVFGFFIEVTKSNLPLVPPDYERRATISHAERFVTPELKALELEILSAEEQSKGLEYELFVAVREQVASHAARLSGMARLLATLDALATLAEDAALYNYVRPTVTDDGQVMIREGRHPVVERTLPEGQRFVPNDTHLDAASERILLLTGPNMSGKSVYIRQVALIALMAQMGSFVPATEAHIGLLDRIFTRVGATDDISQGHSTFLVEMTETSFILHHATPRSLIILDEVGRGTSTYDGMSIAWAVVEDIHDIVGARALFATHYHELTELSAHLSGLVNYAMAVAEQGQEITFLYRVVPGSADKSYGVQVARLAGLPQRVVERAMEVLSRLAQGKPTLPIAEGGGKTLREVGDRYLLSVQDEAALEVLRQIWELDIGNTTPVQAIVLLNALQQRLRHREER